MGPDGGPIPSLFSREKNSIKCIAFHMYQNQAFWTPYHLRRQVGKVILEIEPWNPSDLFATGNFKKTLLLVYLELYSDTVVKEFTCT